MTWLAQEGALPHPAPPLQQGSIIALLLILCGSVDKSLLYLASVGPDDPLVALPAPKSSDLIFLGL